MKNYQLPPLNSLLIFESTARNNSFRLAADELNVTPSAVAYQIKKLEAYINSRLFFRNQRGVELNALGKSYLSSVQEILTLVEQKTKQLHADNSSSKLYVTTLHSIAEKWLMPKFAEFCQNNKGINVQIDATSDPLKKSNADITIDYQTNNYNIDSNHTLLSGDELFPVCSPSFYQKNKVAIDNIDFNQFDIVIDTQWKNDWKYWLAENDMPPLNTENNIITLNLYSMVIESACNNIGMIMGHSKLIDKELKDKKLIAPLAKMKNAKGSYFFFTKKNNFPNESLNIFIDWLVGLR